MSVYVVIYENSWKIYLCIFDRSKRPVFTDSTPNSLTKRKVLSIASHLFDPLGLVLPVTIVARLFIAKLWDEKYCWDQPLPPPKLKAWLNIEKELNTVSRLQFSRWAEFNSSEPVYLHVFTDASKSVIGAVAYLSQGRKSVLIGSELKTSASQ